MSSQNNSSYIIKVSVDSGSSVPVGKLCYCRYKCSQQFKTVICCTNDGYLGEEWVGKEIDESFIEKLPVIVDPCGENGEYHTFCYDGPIFKKKISFKVGEKVYKALEIKTDDNFILPTNITTKGFWYCDLYQLDL